MKLRISLFITLFVNAAFAGTNTKYYKQFQEIFEYIDKEYVAPPDKQKMIEAAFNGMLSELDPHSSYLSPEDLLELDESLKGEFGGIGVEMIYEGGFIKVISPIDDLPAARAGIEAGDLIISVNDESISSIGYMKATKAIRGKPGTKVKITIAKDGDPSKTVDLELTRETVKLKNIKYHIDNNIAYVRISFFNENTTEELRKAVRVMSNDKNIDGIILDLRNNPGGLLDNAIGVSEYFIKSGLIVTTKGRSESNTHSYVSNSFKPKAPEVPLVVLINTGSASASEIVAGAIQDHKRGIILGTKSFGKGSVQTINKTSNGGAVKLSTAMYYTPSGRSIQAEGIEPDIVVEQAKVEYLKTSDSLRKYTESGYRNHLKNSDAKKASKNEDDSKIKKDEVGDLYKNDYQYARAYDLIKGMLRIKK